MPFFASPRVFNQPIFKSFPKSTIRTLYKFLTFISQQILKYFPTKFKSMLKPLYRPLHFQFRQTIRSFIRFHYIQNPFISRMKAIIPLQPTYILFHNQSLLFIEKRHPHHKAMQKTTFSRYKGNMNDVLKGYTAKVQKVFKTMFIPRWILCIVIPQEINFMQIELTEAATGNASVSLLKMYLTG